MVWVKLAATGKNHRPANFVRQWHCFPGHYSHHILSACKTLCVCVCVCVCIVCMCRCAGILLWRTESIYVGSVSPSTFNGEKWELKSGHRPTKPCCQCTWIFLLSVTSVFGSQKAPGLLSDLATSRTLSPWPASFPTQTKHVFNLSEPVNHFN